MSNNKLFHNCFLLHFSIAHIKGADKKASCVNTNGNSLPAIGIPAKLTGKLDVTYTYDIKFEVIF